MIDCRSGRQIPARWSAVRLEVLGNKALGDLGRNLGVGPLILVSPGFNEPEATTNMLATTIEAIFGAIDLDGGESAVLETMKYLKLHEHPALTSTPDISANL